MNSHTATMASNYSQAQDILQGLSTGELVQNDTLFPHWIDGTDFFWYEKLTKLGEGSSAKIGKKYLLVDAKSGIKEDAFDHEELASALADASLKVVDKEDLPISDVSIKLSPVTVSFVAFGQPWLFAADSSRCLIIEDYILNTNESLSPDGKTVAFVRDYNLWLKDIGSGEEWPVTFDGEEDYAYGGSNTSWGNPLPSERPSLWSPDSISLLVVLRDKRQVKALPIIDHVPDDGSLRPTVAYTKVAYPGDEHVETVQLLAVNVKNTKMCEPDYPPQPAGLNHNNGFYFSRFTWWSNDCRHAYFIALERGDRVMRLVEFDTLTGSTRVLFEEISNTHINILNSDALCPTAHRILTNSNELIWWSERSGWGHLYLYDLQSGELTQTITSGDWSVRDVLYVDEPRREVIIQTSGRVLRRNPYYRDICRVQIDTGDVTTLFSTDEDATVHYPESLIVFLEEFLNHVREPTSGVSPDGKYIILTRSRVDRESVTQLLNRDGETILELERTDTTSLPMGWTWPEPVQVHAADGITPLYGVLYRPSNFSPDKSYPLINHTCAAPWLSMIPKGSFNGGQTLYTDMHYFHGAALAELGFIVLQLDSRGTALRGKAFQDESYGQVSNACNSEDHACAIQQLAKCYPSIDMNRIGSFCRGYSSGLVNFLKRQDIYKVHVQAMVMEERFIGCTLSGDKYEGYYKPSDESCNIENLVDNLCGELLLMHPIQGPLTRTYSCAGILRVVDALQKSNKNFDMFMGVGSNITYGNYITRLSWDYLVKNLLKKDPPKEYELLASLI